MFKNSFSTIVAYDSIVKLSNSCWNQTVIYNSWLAVCIIMKQQKLCYCWYSLYVIFITIFMLHSFYLKKVIKKACCSCTYHCSCLQTILKSLLLRIKFDLLLFLAFFQEWILTLISFDLMNRLFMVEAVLSIKYSAFFQEWILALISFA